MRKTTVTDLFCGAGGTSTGAHKAGCKVVLAVNHWDRAVETHSRNFPETLHINSRVEDVPMSSIPRTDILFASPECTGHSRARGDRPTSDQARCDPWSIMRYLDKRRPSWLIVENVAEFQEWGPVGDNGRPMASRRGTIFKQWLGAIESFGYRVDYDVLNAADFGAATSRKRLFVVARKGNRSPRFPEPTHGRHVGGSLPGMGRLPWRPASEIIDWSIPCRSVFLRPIPLKDKTLARLEAGLRRFVSPFMARWDNHGSNGACVNPVSAPLNTLVTKQNCGVAVPYLIDVNHGHNGSENCRLHSLTDPLRTLTASKGKAVAVPFLVEYYGTGGSQPVSRPLGTVTTRDRCGLAYAVLGLAGEIIPRSDGERRLLATMVELGVADLCFRMLSNPELALAQSFPADYQFCGTKAEVTRQIGNAVCPVMAQALTLAALGA